MQVVIKQVEYQGKRSARKGQLCQYSLKKNRKAWGPASCGWPPKPRHSQIQCIRKKGLQLSHPSQRKLRKKKIHHAKEVEKPKKMEIQESREWQRKQEHSSGNKIKGKVQTCPDSRQHKEREFQEESKYKVVKIRKEEIGLLEWYRRDSGNAETLNHQFIVN